PPTSERDFVFLAAPGRVIRLVELLAADRGGRRRSVGSCPGRSWARRPHAATRTATLAVLTPLQELEVVHHHQQFGALLSVLVGPLIQPQVPLDEHLVPLVETLLSEVRLATLLARRT